MDLEEIFGGGGDDAVEPPPAKRQVRRRTAALRPDVEPLAVDVITALEISGLGRTTLYELIQQKRLKTVKVGWRRLINYQSLKALVAPEA
jgi:excisionase family DNA binding protein